MLLIFPKTIEIGSDHRILSARFKIRFRSSKGNPRKRPRYNWDRLIDDPETRIQYSTELSNCFANLSSADSTIQEQYDEITTAISETAQQTLGNPPKKKTHKWVSNDTLELVRRINTAKRDYNTEKQRY